MERIIKLSENDAKNLYEANPELRNTVLKDFSDRELGIDDFPKTWDELGSVGGYYMDGYANIKPSEIASTNDWNKDVAPSVKDVESYLAECQLRQLAKVINNNEIEEKWIDWDDNSQDKFYACFNNFNKNFLIFADDRNNCKAIYFKRREDLKRSLVEHEKLWAQYFKIKQETY